MGTRQPRRGAAWLPLLLPLLLLPPPAAHTGELYCSLPNPRNVHFESTNMKNVLHWLAPEGTGDGVLYNVKYSVYGVGKWIRKPECRNISTTWCDLSSETADHEEQYYASVKAFLKGKCSNWIETTRFNPLTDTKIGPPMVNVSSTEKSISITLTVPEKWRSPDGESISLLQVYPGLQYNVSVLKKKTKKRWFFSISNSTLVVPWLEPGTAYCVSAQIHVTTPLLHSGFSKEHCISTLKDKTTDETITVVFGYILPIVLAVLFTSVACCCVHRYIHVSKQKHPTSLVWHYTDKCKEKVFIPCEKIVVNLITVNVDEHRPSQESIHPSEMKSPRYYTVYSGTEGRDLSPKEVLEIKYLLDISHEEISQEEDILAEGDKTGTKNDQPGTKNTLRQKNGGTVEYELSVRAEDFGPGQNLEELSLKEKTSAPGELGEPQTALENLVNFNTGNAYCPQLEVKAADPSLGQELEELKLKMADAVDELLGKTCINLVDSDDEKSGQTSYHWLGKIAHGVTENESEQTILVDWDPHTGRLYIPTWFTVENEVCKGVFKCDVPNKEGLLSRLYEKQVSEEPSEDQEMYLLQFQEQWGLHVEMED
ncbi:interleukin-20 receptor subunit alpha isoform X1 [Lagopus muta]|uniref:interleukin-20 receptor subunit alpha isoform X1 n=2 Tax=Lagopus muta TaxID=64668 RepID=UPI00209DC873|nr:interleukin-20 receptor subunit alpha isoform X1 [Lagopus muta]